MFKRKVLVTAGASGIGRSMAEKFFQKGHDVWIVDINANALDNCSHEWKRSHLDVSDEIAVKELFLEIINFEMVINGH